MRAKTSKADTSKADAPSGKRRRWLRFGPGTILALIAAIGLAVAGRSVKQPTLNSNAGRIVYEADSQGQLRRVDAPSKQQTAPSRLWKPEPGFLLDHLQELKLDAWQRKEIETLNMAWLSEKAPLEQQINHAESGANPPAQQTELGHNASITQVMDNLKDYSQLSRQYDERRTGYWKRSLALLTAGQQEQLSKITATIRSTR